MKATIFAIVLALFFTGCQSVTTFNAVNKKDNTFYEGKYVKENAMMKTGKGTLIFSEYKGFCNNTLKNMNGYASEVEGNCIITNKKEAIDCKLIMNPIDGGLESGKCGDYFLIKN